MQWYTEKYYEMKEKQQRDWAANWVSSRQIWVFDNANMVSWKTTKDGKYQVEKTGTMDIHNKTYCFKMTQNKKSGFKKYWNVMEGQAEELLDRKMASGIISKIKSKK